MYMESSLVCYKQFKLTNCIQANEITSIKKKKKQCLKCYIKEFNKALYGEDDVSKNII